MNLDAASNPEDFDRYSRQILFPRIGIEGQRKLAAGTALVVGCGALGSVIAETLVRAGVGCVRIVDRDYLELHNLQRQVLFDEADVESGLPKAIAAKRKLETINSQVRVEAFVEDLSHRTISRLAAGVTVIVDGTDNFEARFLINDYAMESGIPWIYGGCIGSEGQSMTVVPGQSNCLNCLMVDGPPPPGTTAGCDVAGVIGPAVNMVASIQSAEALKILSGNVEHVSRDLTVVDLWLNRFTKMKLGNLAEKVACPTCRQGHRAWLSGEQATTTAILCGRNSVQIKPAGDAAVDLVELGERLRRHGEVQQNEYL
ncbi:MAG: ThiF family adenylyltransferase, partial [Pirellulaceae bacterium]|nr:ThiF family adenylyltransferase [Pirellulaceae bacterium]